MATNDQNVRVTVDRSEFAEAVRLMLSRRQSAAPEVRAEIDRALERLHAGDSEDRMRVCWRETTPDGDSVVHITAGPALLELALPSTEVDTD